MKSMVSPTSPTFSSYAPTRAQAMIHLHVGDVSDVGDSVEIIGEFLSPTFRMSPTSVGDRGERVLPGLWL